MKYRVVIEKIGVVRPLWRVRVFEWETSLCYQDFFNSEEEAKEAAKRF